jgi:hypothetical protein
LSNSAPAKRDADLVIMAVRIFALALVVAQVMSRGKGIVNRNFEHASLSGRRQYMDGPRLTSRKHLIVPLTAAIPLDSTTMAKQICRIRSGYAGAY